MFTPSQQSLSTVYLAKLCAPAVLQLKNLIIYANLCFIFYHILINLYYCVVVVYFTVRCDLQHVEFLTTL